MPRPFRRSEIGNLSVRSLRCKWQRCRRPGCTGQTRRRRRVAPARHLPQPYLRAAGWCFHNGAQAGRQDGVPRRSFDLRETRLYDQFDSAELEVTRKVKGIAANGN